MNIYSLLQKILFLFDPEDAHEIIIQLLEKIPRSESLNLFPNDTKYITKNTYFSWPNPIGVAAGLDKNAQAFSTLGQIGFGHVEVGTVTLKSQKGNPRPRIWRLKENHSLRNSMGFPSWGSDAMIKQILAHKKHSILGINIGKNKETSLEDSVAEYSLLYQKMAPFSDYIAINISSPNTPGLRSLQGSDYLDSLLSAMQEVQAKYFKPLYLKISPDLSLKELENIFELCLKYSIQGIIATNTTIDHSFSSGGVSGHLLYSKAQIIREHLLKINQNKLEIIGVGGFSTIEEIFSYWAQGGTTIQIYSSFVYKGPMFLKEIKKSIDLKLQETGLNSLSEAFINPEIFATKKNSISLK